MTALEAFKLATSYNEAAESHWKACREAQSLGDWKEANRQAELARKAERSNQRFDNLLRHGL